MKESLTATGLTANASYDGSTDINLLDATQPETLAVGTKTIRLTVKVTPGANLGPYNNTAFVSGVSPADRVVGDASDNGSLPDPNGNGNPSEPGENDPTPVTFDYPVIGVAKSVASVVNNGGGTLHRRLRPGGGEPGPGGAEQRPGDRQLAGGLQGVGASP